MDEALEEEEVRNAEPGKTSSTNVSRPNSPAWRGRNVLTDRRP